MGWRNGECKQAVSVPEPGAMIMWWRGGAVFGICPEPSNQPGSALTLSFAHPILSERRNTNAIALESFRVLRRGSLLPSPHTHTHTTAPAHTYTHSNTVAEAVTHTHTHTHIHSIIHTISPYA